MSQQGENKVDIQKYLVGLRQQMVLIQEGNKESILRIFDDMSMQFIKTFSTLNREIEELKNPKKDLPPNKLKEELKKMKEDLKKK